MSERSVTLDDVRRAHDRICPHLAPTPLRNYAELDDVVGHDIRVLVKHENHQPTNAFKVRTNLAALTALDPAERRRGVIAATRGNHGLGLAWAAKLLGATAVVCVPHGNNPEKNRAIRGLGAELIEAGRDWDACDETTQRLVVERRLSLVHPINDPEIVAGAATLTLEMLEASEDLNALVVQVGGGSMIAGAVTVVRALRPDLEIFAVQAAGAPAIHDSWHAREPLSRPRADTMADGLATRNCYPFTFGPMLAGLTDFVTVTEGEIADAVRTFLSTTHNLAEPAAATGLAGLRRLAPRLAGRHVGVILSGGNVDSEVLRAILAGEIGATGERAS